jgi:hypothetical protein
MPESVIKIWPDGAVLASGEGDVRLVLERAVAAGADLAGAGLAGADLAGACLGGARLAGANLRGANLGHANLRGARLAGANLILADLSLADLAVADLAGADLAGARLFRTHMRAVNLRGARLNWQSRGLVAELLRRAAGGDPDRLGVAGVVLLAGRCWPYYLGQAAHPQYDWAMDVLAGFVRDDDRAPAALRARADALRARADAPATPPEASADGRPPCLSREDG